MACTHNMCTAGLHKSLMLKQARHFPTANNDVDDPRKRYLFLTACVCACACMRMPGRKKENVQQTDRLISHWILTLNRKEDNQDISRSV